MKIVMLLGNDCIDAIDVERSAVTLPGYVRHFVRLLKNKHRILLAELNTEPEFLFLDQGTPEACAAQPADTPCSRHNIPVHPRVKHPKI